MRKWIIGVSFSTLILGAFAFPSMGKKVKADELVLVTNSNPSLNSEAAQRYIKVQPKHWRAAMVKGFGYSAMR